jgi:hypothetical protein
MNFRPAVVALALLLASGAAHAGVTVRKVGENSEIVRATGKLMKKGGEPKPDAPSLSFRCTLSSGIGWCELSVLAKRKQILGPVRLDVTHDDGDTIVAGSDDVPDKITIGRKAKSFEWDPGDETTPVMVLVPGS